MSEWAAYLNWAVEAFRLNAAVARDETQIHTHMSDARLLQVFDFITQRQRDLFRDGFA